LAGRLIAELARVATALDKDASRVRRRYSEPALERLQQSAAAADEAIGWCSLGLMWDADVAEGCARLLAPRQAAREAELAALAELRRRRIDASARSWRAIFPRCRALKGVLEGLRREASCEGPCRSVVARAERDFRKLAAFSVDGELDEATRDVVRSECHDAGCPACP
jgi:hypothetical protein